MLVEKVEKLLMSNPKKPHIQICCVFDCFNILIASVLNRGLEVIVSKHGQLSLDW